MNFSKSQALHAGSYKKELIKQDKWYGHNFPLKYLGYILVVLVAKKIYIWKSAAHFEMKKKKKNFKSNSLVRNLM